MKYILKSALFDHFFFQIKCKFYRYGQLEEFVRGLEKQKSSTCFTAIRLTQWLNMQQPAISQ